MRLLNIGACLSDAPHFQKQNGMEAYLRAANVIQHRISSKTDINLWQLSCGCLLCFKTEECGGAE